MRIQKMCVDWIDIAMQRIQSISPTSMHISLQSKCRIERLVVSQPNSEYFPTAVCMKEGLREIWLAEILRN